MADYTLPYFGQIMLDDLDGFYDADIRINDKDIPVNLTFDETTIEKKQMDAARDFIERLEQYNTQNNDYIKKDYNNEGGDTVRYYLQYHLENLNKENLSELIDLNSGIVGAEEQLLNKLQLVRIALYPHSENYLAIFDYSIGQHLTNHVVVISTDKDGNLHHMTMES